MTQKTHHHPKPLDNTILKMRIFVRTKDTDLPSANYGKAIAQASHASTGLIGNLCDSPEYSNWDPNGIGFGYALTYAASLADIDEVESKVNMYEDIIPIYIVEDPSYPFWVSEELVPFFDKQMVEVTDVTRPGEVLCLRSEVTALAILCTDKVFKDIAPKAKLMKE